MGKRKKQAFVSVLGKAGYSNKVSNEVWKWYTASTQQELGENEDSDTKSIG